MKKILFVALIMILVVANICLASPYLVCDPQPGVNWYEVSGLPSSIPASNVPIDSTGKYGFILDLASLPAGSYTVTAKACSEFWGCSPSSNPFTFTRPSQFTSPAGVKLAK